MSHYVINEGTVCKIRRSRREAWADHATTAVLQFGTKQRQRNEDDLWVFRTRDGAWLGFTPGHVRQYDGGRATAASRRRRDRKPKPLEGVAAIANSFGLYLMPKEGSESIRVVHDLKSGRSIGWVVPDTGRYKLYGKAGVGKDLRDVFRIARAG